MMAAGIAAQTISKQVTTGNVLLLEKNDRLGRKLIITGNGRCNLTNTSHVGSFVVGQNDGKESRPAVGLEDVRSFTKKFGKQGKFLNPAMRSFGTVDTIRFFEDHGLEVKTEEGGRVFPASDKALDVRKVLLRFLKENNVVIERNARVMGFTMENIVGIGVKEIGPGGKGTSDGMRIRGVRCTIGGDEMDITADQFILCTGGVSFPSTGSSGEGLIWASKFGHTIIKPRPGLTSVIVREDWIGKLQAVSFKDARVNVYCGNKKREEARGELLFTHDGLSGPVILGLSRRIGELIYDHHDPRGTPVDDPHLVQLKVDLLPDIDNAALDRILQGKFAEQGNRLAVQCLSGILPGKAAAVIVELSGIDGRGKMNSITREERKHLMRLMKDLSINVEDLSGFKKAMITVGGVSLQEIDPGTMRSKLVDNLYFAGEVMDLDGPSGGFNLQICWSTGHLAGESAGRENLKHGLMRRSWS